MAKKKSKRQGAMADDKMLAEVTAADSKLPTEDPAETAATPNNAPGGSSSRSDISSSISSSTNSSGTSASEQEAIVPDKAIIDACKQGTISQLRRWGRQGVRVKSARPLINSVALGANLESLRCLVRELGADVNRAARPCSWQLRRES